MNLSIQWEKDLAAKDQEYYQQLYQYEGEGKAKGDIELFLLKAKQIPKQQLNQIIGAAYQSNGANFDNKKSFYMALKLIACAQYNINPSTPILSTDTPLPSFEDYDLITNKDRQKYIRIFHAAGPTNGYLSGQDAMKILMRSKLPIGLLSQIWNLSDILEEGKLNVHGFIIAMHYVAKCMNGNTSLPESKVPHSILLSAFADNPQLLSSLNISKVATTNENKNTTITSPQMGSPVKNNNSPDENQLFSPIHSSSPWVINNNEYATYVNAFKTIDTQNRGFIEGNQAVGFFNHSHLPPSDLANIWDLADTRNSGKLNMGEFAIAMHLIRRLRGGSSFSSFPSSLHDTLLSQIQAKSKPSTSSTESHESLKAQTIELQNNIKKEQSVISGLNEEIQQQDEVLNTLRETVKALEDTLQQTINQKLELQDLLNSMKKSEIDKRHKIATLEKEYNNNQSEIKTLKAMHQQQLVFSGVSDRQLEAAQQQRDRSAEDLALAQEGQFDKLSDSPPPVVKQNIPKPPPPSSRHHRTQSVRTSSNATSTRKPPAPPPSKKNRASVVMTSPSVETNNENSSSNTADKSIKEEEQEEEKNVAPPLSAVAIAASVTSVIASSNVNMDSIVSSAVRQKEQSSTESSSIDQENESASQPVSIKNNQFISNVVDNTYQQLSQTAISDSSDDDDDDDDNNTPSDTSSEVTSENEASISQSSVTAAAASSEQATTTTTTPTVHQSETESNDLAKVKEKNYDDESSAIVQPKTVQANNKGDREISGITDSKIAKDESREIHTDHDNENENEGFKIQQDIAKATNEAITNNDNDNSNDIENNPNNIAKDNSISAINTSAAGDDDVDDDDDDVDLKKDEQNMEPVITNENVNDSSDLNKTINEVESSSTNNDNNGNALLKSIDEPTNINESTSKADDVEQGKQQQQQNDKIKKDMQVTKEEVDNNNKNDKSYQSDNSNKTSSIEDKSPGSFTSTKGDDHDDFEVLENTSTSSSFMSASMGMDDDAIDEFDAAFAETLPDAKVVTSNINAPITTSNKKYSEKKNQPLTEDHFYNEDDFDNAFGGNKEFDSVPTSTVITTAIPTSTSNEKNKNNNQAVSSVTQNEQIKKKDPFWVDDSSVQNAFEDSFTPVTNKDSSKNNLTFGDAFTPSGGFGDSFTATTNSTHHQEGFGNNYSNDTITKNSNNANETNNNNNNNNNNIFSDSNEFSDIMEKNKTFNSQSPFNNPFEEFTEKDNTTDINQYQDHQQTPTIKDINTFADSHNKNNLKEITEDNNKSTEPTIITPTNTTISPAVPSITQSTGSSISIPQSVSQQQHQSSPKKVEQSSTKHNENDHSTSASKGKHKGLFSLSSMLPKQKGKKSKSKSSNKKEKATVANTANHQSTATLSSTHSHNSNTNEFLETSVPHLTEQEVMANLREFGNDTESVTTIVNMGFSVAEAKEALKRYDYDVEKALNFLLDQ